MAVRLYTSREVEKICFAGLIAYETHMMLLSRLEPGVSTRQLNDWANEFIIKKGAKAAFLGFMGYPGHICTSVNDAVVHGIPNERVILKESDIIGIDIGIEFDGYYADTAWTWPIGRVPAETVKLLQVSHRSLFRGIDAAIPGNRIGAIGNSVQTCVESAGFSVVRSLVGHGVGKSIHEEPQVPNYGRKKDGPLIKPGMVLAIEPMVNSGRADVVTDSDKWTVRTRDGRLSAHYEHTVAVTADGPKICTLPAGMGFKEAMEIMKVV